MALSRSHETQSVDSQPSILVIPQLGRPLQQIQLCLQAPHFGSLVRCGREDHGNTLNMRQIVQPTTLCSARWRQPAGEDEVYEMIKWRHSAASSHLRSRCDGPVCSERTVWQKGSDSHNSYMHVRDQSRQEAVASIYTNIQASSCS